jgi:hypothetical protein
MGALLIIDQNNYYKLQKINIKINPLHPAPRSLLTDKLID